MILSTLIELLELSKDLHWDQYVEINRWDERFCIFDTEYENWIHRILCKDFIKRETDK